ncbi:hypothetical protein B0J14DRAFT_471157, partial [Halenospora varia]
FSTFFAAIIGRSMKFVAQAMLETGASIDTLERLVGSQSAFAAFMTQITMPKLGPSSIGILLLWAFAPLKGQASLRILITRYDNVTSSANFVYLNMTRQLSTFDAGCSNSDSKYSVDALYTGCLIGTPSTKSGSQDSWGHIKIPWVEALNSSSPDAGWISVPNISTTYSSLLGFPISGIPDNQNSSFELTYYFSMQCPLVGVINTTSGD